MSTTAADREEAARALERSNLCAYWHTELRAALRRASAGNASIERLAYMLVCARAGGVDVLEAVRIAQHRMDELELEAAVPVHQNTGPTTTSPLRLVDTGPND